MKINLRILWATLFVLLSTMGFAHNFNIEKTNKFRKPKTHPYQKFFEFSETSKESRSKLSNLERDSVLVILVDFQLDDNPNTTGDGKFVLEDENYPISIGAPPHDREFYEAHMLAAKYYYKAASHGGYDMKYDVFPKDKQAYTLPNEMAYYNPGINNQSLFLERTEEYFKDAFQEADKDSAIKFSNYHHFIIIHAGSDWQHDVKSDSPNDLPTVHVALEPRAAIPVDNGEYIISYAISIPEVITQDITETINNPNEQPDSQTKSYSGYGLSISNIVHEFGHSLGLVDLYNTFNNFPHVGYLDIMDSGGNGVALTSDNDGNYYEIEGYLPGLPGAFSRLLLWGEDYYRNLGLLKDIGDIPFDKDFEMRSISKFYNSNGDQTFMVKVPINEKEYILIENRQLNPYDAPIVMKGGLPASGNLEGYRVPLYPVIDDGENIPNYAYDMLLPGFVERRYEPHTYDNYMGGGLVFWYIDEAQMYDEGEYLSDGTFVSNFDLNKVNAKYNDKAVSVIEADGLLDIGEPNSYYWKGTEYEPFYAHLPTLENGFFTGWSDTVHNRELSSTTTPALKTKDGEPILYRFYNISDSRPGTEDELGMTLSVGTSSFDETQRVAKIKSHRNFDIGQITSTNDIYTASELSIVYNYGNNIPANANTEDFPLTHTFSHYFSNDPPRDYWENDKPNFNHGNMIPDFPVVVFDMGHDDYSENFIIDGNKLAYFFENEGEIIDYESDITDTPVAWEQEDRIYYAVPTKQKLHIQTLGEELNLNFPIEDSQVYHSGKYLIAQIENYIYLINTNNLMEQIKSYYIPNLTKKSKVVCFDEINSSSTPIMFAINEDNFVYRIKDDAVKKIFDLNDYNTTSFTQIGLGFEKNYNINYLTFGTNNRIFAMDFDGNMIPGFPLRNYDFNIEEYSDIFCISGANKVDPETNMESSEFSTIYFKDINSGFFVTRLDGTMDVANSLYWKQQNRDIRFAWEDASKRLYFVYVDSENNLMVSYKKAFTENPIHWNGYKNGLNGSRSGSLEHNVVNSSKKEVFAYPNPTKSNKMAIAMTGLDGEVKIKIYDIAGNLVHKGSHEIKDSHVRSEYRGWNINKVSPGIYIAVVKSKNFSKQIKIAIEK